jgi:hypothetical protein
MDKKILLTYPAGKTGISYDVSSSVTSIGEYAFYDCENLTSVTIPSSVTSIGKEAFAHCSEELVICGHSGSYAETYAGDNGITFVALLNPDEKQYTTSEQPIQSSRERDDTTAPASVPAAGTTVKDEKSGSAYKVSSTDSENPTVTYTGTTDKKAKTVNVPATVTADGVTYQVTAIADNAFKGNKTITKVTVGNNITSVGANAFSGCTKLKTVTIGNNVTSIGTNAFKGCSSLTKLTVPTKVTKIGANAFSGCKKLKTLTIKNTKLTKKSIAKNAFKGLTKATTIKVPKSKLSAYKKLFKSKGLSSKVKVTK